jgi:hypothetical protein
MNKHFFRMATVAHQKGLFLALLLASGQAMADDAVNKGQLAGQSSAVSRATSSVLSTAILSNMLGGSGIFRMKIGTLEDCPLSTLECVGDGADRGGRGLWRGGGVAAAGDSDSNWSIWFTPARSSFANNVQPFTSKGDVTLGLVGLEYNHEDRLVGGVALSVDRLSATTTYNGGKLTGGGVTVSPYMVYSLNEAWLLDASFGVGRSNLDSQVGSVTGSPSTDRFFSSVGVTHLRMFGKATMMGKASFNYFNDDIKAYQSSDLVVNDPLQTKLSQFKIGGQVSYDAKPLVPFFGVYQYFNNLNSSAPARSSQEHSSTWQFAAGLNASHGIFYGSLSYQVERDKNQFRFYGGVRF